MYKDYWSSLKEETKLKFSIPNKKLDKKNSQLISIRDVVKSLDKTNFMYSIIMNKKEIELLPNYIEEGLLWLDQQLSIG